MGRKVLVFGLDCGEPSLIFNRYKGQLPTLNRLMDGGTWGELRSVVPPITCPAWMCMMSSKNPGKLGIYGFRHRKKGADYGSMYLANSTTVKERLLWDELGDAGLKVGLLAIPQTYPLRPVNGWMVGDFLTPDIQSEYTFPSELKQEIAAEIGEYELDYSNRKEVPPEEVIAGVTSMTKKRFKVLRKFLQNKPWDFAMMHEIGLDRIQHYLWSYSDPTHHKYVKGNPYEGALLQYHKLLDQEIAEVLKLIPEDTVVMVVSDHGGKAMKGAFCINEWLIQNGWMTLKSRPASVSKLEKCDIDWTKTKAWAEGGYYSRIFLNVEGREPQGVVPQDQLKAVRDELKAQLEAVPDMEGMPMKNLVFAPEEYYPVANGDPSDLMAFFGDLQYRAAGTLGHPSLYLLENDTGPDDGVHDWEGICILFDPKQPGKGQVPELSILDVAPTILTKFGLPIPSDYEGKPIA
ncbi:MAG: alkaline phosphatase family protein [Patescibacteria group bacterium]